MPVDVETLLAIESLFPDGDMVEAIAHSGAFGSRLALLGEMATDDLEIAMIGPGGFTGSFSGVEGFESAWRDWLGPFASYRIEQNRDYRLGDDVAVFFARQVGIPKGGSNPIEHEAASVFFFRDGKVRRIEFHLDRASALRSAGLD
jgi:ketosteroid isomerase-like protein